jgi:hypothetical protein
MMNGTDLGRTPAPLAPGVASLLAYERDVVPQAEMVRARVLARARESLQQADVIALAARRSRPRLRVFYAAAAGVALMAGAAAAYEMLWRPEPPATAPRTAPQGQGRVLRSKPIAEPEAPPVMVPEPALPSTLQAQDPAPVPGRRIGAASKSEARAEELRLLVRARQADARREYGVVLTVLAEHERRHPTGRLSEEREVLRIKALVGMGRAREARQHGATFRRHFPHSVLLHKVEDMLASAK